MKKLKRNVLEQLISGSAEPMLIARIDQPDWPVVLGNVAFEELAGDKSVLEEPLADVIERLLGRDLALEISETVRAGQETSLAIELDGREYLLVLKPVSSTDADASYYLAYWRGAAGGSYAADGEIQQALVRAKRRIRDLSREDPVTGLLNEKSFNEVLAHDWAVAGREKSCLALVSLSLDDFDAYLEVFGRHAADSCQRRVAQAVRRCLRRASDVAAKITHNDVDYLVVLSHASDEDGVREFAQSIAASVRELGLHHPRSRAARFVTVSWEVSIKNAADDKSGAADLLKSALKS
jgi:diguanylate cyclase (GGDEF)-like protein